MTLYNEALVLKVPLCKKHTRNCKPFSLKMFNKRYYVIDPVLSSTFCCECMSLLYAYNYDFIIRSVTAVSICGSNLSNSDFSGMDFSGVDFTDSDIRSTNFSNSNFSRVDLINVNASRVDFRGVKFFNARFKHVDFVGSNLAGADFTGVAYDKFSLGTMNDAFKDELISLGVRTD